MQIQISFPHVSYQAVWTHFINIFQQSDKSKLRISGFGVNGTGGV